MIEKFLKILCQLMVKFNNKKSKTIQLHIILLMIPIAITLHNDFYSYYK